MDIPFSNTLPINKLASSLNKTVATYKYYWLIAIIELVENGKYEINKKDIFTRMISNAWYSINYFHLSYGKQDLIQQAVEGILLSENLSIDIRKENLNSVLENSENRSTQQLLFHFDKNVPHWFLSSWFPKISGERDTDHKNRIYSSSESFDNGCLYALYRDKIIINPMWVTYLKLNSKILKDFCYWNLALFLQNRNPNVPDIPNKLIKPAIRCALTQQRTNYWNIVFKELGSVNCIFTGNKLVIDNFAIDHFVPHAFVSHDLIWNLIPIDKNFNSSKSDKLPSVDKYFDQFFKVQNEAFEIVSKSYPKNRLIQDFLSIFPDLENTKKLDSVKYRETIQPLITIAHNNGFSYLHE